MIKLLLTFALLIAAPLAGATGKQGHSCAKGDKACLKKKAKKAKKLAKKTNKKAPKATAVKKTEKKKKIATSPPPAPPAPVEPPVDDASFPPPTDASAPAGSEPKTAESDDLDFDDEPKQE